MREEEEERLHLRSKTRSVWGIEEGGVPFASTSWRRPRVAQVVNPFCRVLDTLQSRIVSLGRRSKGGLKKAADSRGALRAGAAGRA